MNRTKFPIHRKGVSEGLELSSLFREKFLFKLPKFSFKNIFFLEQIVTVIFATYVYPLLLISEFMLFESSVFKTCFKITP
jgi:hypothetical protein